MAFTAPVVYGRTADTLNVADDVAVAVHAMARACAPLVLVPSVAICVYVSLLPVGAVFNAPPLLFAAIEATTIRSPVWTVMLTVFGVVIVLNTDAP
jgi:hypothetical protein